MRSQLLRFLLAGAVNTGATYLLYLGLLHVVHYQIAYGIAYVAGIVLSYLLNSRYVFRTPLSTKSFLFFPLVYLAQYTFGVVLLYLLVEQADISPRLAMIAVVALSIPLTFVLTRILLVRLQ
jgi:putative flippase GtrA